MKMAPTTNAPEEQTALGLRQRIRKAATLGELGSLLLEGKQYIYASNATRAAWHRTAERRRKELGA